MKHETLERIAAALTKLVEDFFRPPALGRARAPGELACDLPLEVPAQGMDFAGIERAMAAFLDGSFRARHPRFMNTLLSPGHEVALLGDVLGAVVNTTMATYESSPAGTLVERALIAKLGRCMGLEPCDGLLTSGGSMSNMLAMLCARHRAAPDAKRRGLSGTRRLAIFTSDQAHYSIASAAQALGLGEDSVVTVAADDLGRMQPERLEEAIAAACARGEQPFLVIGTAGTTVLGAFDPLDAIGEVARRHGCWFHVDACFGGAAALCSEGRAMLAGVERADSIAWDQHKLMGVPLSCSALLTPHADLLNTAVVAGDGSYLFHGGEAPLDLGLKSLQCGRRIDAWKAWLMWLYLGEEGYEARTRRLFEIARHAGEVVQRHAKLELVFPVLSFCVNFRVTPPDGEDANAFNLRLRERLMERGVAVLNYAKTRGVLHFRWAVTNPDLTREDVERLFADVAAC